MLAQILLLMAAADAQAAPSATAPPSTPAPAQALQPKTVSPVEVPQPTKASPPDVKIDMQGSDDDLEQQVVIWPGAAYQAGRRGLVTLRCLVDAHGLAERCNVASESPEGKGFGKAALELRTTLKIPPTMGPDGPVASVKTISLTFKPPERNFEMKKVMSGDTFGAGNPLAMRAVTMLDYPMWAQAASFDDLARAYPAKGGGEEGYAAVHCRVQHSGSLTDCEAIKEVPEGKDFGKAAVALAAKFKVAPQLAQARHRDQLWVDIPIRLPPPAQAVERTVTSPAWITGFDRKAAPKLFPPEAVASGLTSGRGVARCVVAADGALTQCAPEAAEPAGLGFSEAAAKLASTMKMNLWSTDGAPVEGGVVHIPIRLNLKAVGG
jgi:TonB family protein